MPVSYPRLIKRVRAVLIDSVVLPVTVFLILLFGDSVGVSGAYAKALLIALPIFLLEPGLVALTGGTVGHHWLNIRVAKRDGAGNINILAATVRFIVKLCLGWLSFIFVLTTAKHQAVHDLLAGSIVVHKDAAGLPAHEVLSERIQETDAYVYPAAWRRVAVISAYWLLVSVALGLGSYVVSTAGCAKGQGCTTVDHLANMVLDIAWLVGLGWVTVQGWSGKLLGCRRHERSSEASMSRSHRDTVSAASAINARLPGAYFHDCYTISVPDGSLSAFGYFLAAVADTPRWVVRLMALRNRIVQLVGLKDLGGLGDFDAAKPASAYVPGDRVGIFTLISSTDDEALLGDSDKHLDVVLSVFRHAPGADGARAISITTVVHVHNLLGRLYMLPVAPLHRLIAPAMLDRLHTATS